MDCRTVRDQLSTYLDYDLSPEARLLMDQHFEACPPCRTTLMQLRTVTAWVGELPPINPSATFQQQLHERLEHLQQPMRARLFRRLAGAIPLQAAAALVVVVSAALIWQMMPYPWQESGRLSDPTPDSKSRMSGEPGLVPVPADLAPTEPGLDDPSPPSAPIVLVPPRSPWLAGRQEVVRIGREPAFVPVMGVSGESRGAELALFPSLILRAEDPVQTAQHIWELVPDTGGALLQSQGMLTPVGRTVRGPVRLTMALPANRYQTLLEIIRQIPGTVLAEERMAVVGRELPPGGVPSPWRVEHAPPSHLPTVTLVITVFPR